MDIIGNRTCNKCKKEKGEKQGMRNIARKLVTLFTKPGEHIWMQCGAHSLYYVEKQ